jgi:hypothetical protein
MIKPIHFIALLAALAVAGCSSGEFRAEEVPSRAEIQKQIDQVKSNPSIPEAAKPGIIQGLQKKMEHAKG